jgi:hypothetical protein
MKTRLSKTFAVSFAALVASAGTASAAEVKFAGTFLLRAKSAGCSASIPLRSQALMFYWPPNLSTNGADSSIILRDWFDTGNTQHFRLASGSLVGSSYKPVTVTTIFNRGGGGGNQHGATMRFSSQSPATVTSTTPNIKISGAITNWYSDADCTVSFSAVLNRAPNLP